MRRNPSHSVFEGEEGEDRMHCESRTELKKKGSEIKPTVHIGMDGITDGVIEEVNLQIKKNMLVKVRILPSVKRSREEVAKDLESRTSSRLVEIRGNTVLLCEDSLFQVEKRSN
jgi:RNA-binding protein